METDDERNVPDRQVSGDATGLRVAPALPQVPLTFNTSHFSWVDEMMDKTRDASELKTPNASR